MISTRGSTELARVALPDRGDGGGEVSAWRQPSGKILVKRIAARGGVVNHIDRYEQVVGNVTETRALTEEVAREIVSEAAVGQKSWASCFIRGDVVHGDGIVWVKTESEHKYTSTGVKFWRHREAMEQYRVGGGRTVVSTHVSPEGACNLKCPFCSVSYRDTHSRIPLERVKKYITDLKSRGLKAVILTGGGEPTAYPDFNALVWWIKRWMGLSVALITNGTLADRVTTEAWKCFSWVRVSVNVFDGWERKIAIPRAALDPACVVGASFVYTVEHEATKEEVPLDRAELFKRVSGVADRIGAEYIRVLPNCLLEQPELLLQHCSIEETAKRIGDPRYFHQFKIHGAPGASTCHQAHFRPYLSEEPFGDTGEPGTVYPCDSVVLNGAATHFARQYQICRVEDVLKFLDGEISMNFDPRAACSGCVFTSNVDMLDSYVKTGENRFDEFRDPLVHEEFI